MILNKKIRSKKNSPFVLFPKTIGYRLYVVAFFAFVTSLFETLALSMIAPLISNSSENGEIIGWFYSNLIVLIDQISFFGVENTKIKILIFLVLLFYLKSIGTFWVGRSIAIIKSDFLEKVRNKILSNLLSMSVSDISAQTPTYYSNLLVDQADRSIVSLGFFMQAITKYLAAILYLIFGLFMAPQFGFITICTCTLVVVVFRVITLRVNKMSRIFADKNARLATLISTVVGNLKYLTVTSQKDGPLISGLFSSIVSVGTLQKDLSTKEALTISARDAIIISVLAIVLLPQFKAGTDVSANLVSILLMYRSMSATLMAQKVLQNSQEYFGSFLHLQSLITGHEENSQKNSPAKNNASLLDWDQLRLSNISKNYNGENILKNVNLVIEKGTFVCIMGPSGTGKTTLVDIALKVIDPTTGSVDYYLNDEVQNNVTNTIGYVTQTNSTFQGSVLENITMWECPVRISKVESLLSELGLVSKTSEYRSFLEKQVDRLSGGEQQRVALARELYRGVNILVLDEPTSALDAKNRDVLVSKIKSLTPEVTIIAISHDVEFASASDEIIDMRKRYFEKSKL